MKYLSSKLIAAALSAAPLILVGLTTPIFAQEPPTIFYKVEIGEDGELKVLKPEKEKLPAVAGEKELKFMDAAEAAKEMMSGGYVGSAGDAMANAAWIVMDPRGNIVGAAPAGETRLLQSLETGNSLQVVDFGKFTPAGIFGNKPSIEDMQESIKTQMRAAAAAFKSEVCDNMKDWESVKFSFEIGAEALVVAKVLGEGTFVPSKVCK